MGQDGRVSAPPQRPEPHPAPQQQPPPEGGHDLLVITGLSGAGRSTVAHVLEDLGWYVVDNLPPQMLGPLAQLAAQASGAVPKVAVVLDVRGRGFSADLAAALAAVRVRRSILFLEASDGVLVRRFESVRRPHPLQEEGRILDGIETERELLRDLRAAADVVIDTSDLNVHQLAASITRAFGEAEATRLRLTLLSFGFKYGLPTDADHVVDVRFLPNPHWVPELRPLTGRDAPVSSYVLGQDGAEEFLDRYAAALQPVIAGYQREHRRYATVAIGCTGGKHRSVAMTEALAARLQAVADAAASPLASSSAAPSPAEGAEEHPAPVLRVAHRDLGRE
ncbi:RNase adapter RapZ [Quadrisphaera oryzae]|uniref:RNase adapter RapZ n=1 Tax=Quadrisphaera TaxID=317661 RepID=UPI001648ED8F|nr:RNase adapter RapZ [Quadrisphaera sp. RL12-1S]MBC3762115.1 RNase adapter RapZ [Quadrisphaera sp. RL12-1S]